MIPFERLKLTDRERLYRCCVDSDRQGCEYSFVNLYLWGRQHVAWVEDHMVVFSHFNGHSVYMYPAGVGDLRPVLEALKADAHERGIPFRLATMSADDCCELEQLYPGKFLIRADRDSYDYVYNIEHLAELRGKHYQQKRNHVNRFKTACPDWELYPITPERFTDCHTVLDAWYQKRQEEDPHQDYHLEQLAMERAFQHWQKLNLEGLILYSEPGQPAAMTIGSRLSPHIYDVHFEKALDTVPGAYAMINQSFAQCIHEKHPEVTHLNREEDMGLPGLRKAKESYHPDILLEQYWCVLREDIDEF